MDKAFSWSDLYRLLLHSERGPNRPITDHRVVAGLLFCRYNDGSVRRLYVHETPPRIEVAFYSDRPSSCGTIYNVNTTQEVVGELRRFGFLKQARYYGTHVDFMLVLSDEGKRAVVESFVSDLDLYDCLVAGASYQTDTGTLRW